MSRFQPRQPGGRPTRPCDGAACHLPLANMRLSILNAEAPFTLSVWLAGGVWRRENPVKNKRFISVPRLMCCAFIRDINYELNQ